MQEIAALSAQDRLQARGRPLMRQGQIDDETFAQMGDFTGAQANVLRPQLGDNFLGAPMPQEQSLADKADHIIPKGTTRGD
jgi:hypothetical protein